MGGHDPYSSSKGAAELVISAYRRSFFETGARIASVRAGNVIGGGDWATDRLIPDIVRAMIVGERTFGKGSVQMLFPLARELGRPSAYLKLTTSHYYLPSDKCIHREENSTEWGVEPDVKIEMTPEQMRAAIDARQELDVLRKANDNKPEEKKPESAAAEQEAAQEPPGDTQ